MSHARLARLIVPCAAIAALSGLALAEPLLLTPEGSTWTLAAENPDTASVRICWERVESDPPVDLGCRVAAAGERVGMVAEVAFTPGQDAEIRARSCYPTEAPGVHPEAICSAYSADHYPVRMTAPVGPLLLGVP